MSTQPASRRYLGTNKAPAVFEWFGGRPDLMMPVVQRIWLDSMPQLLVTWPGAQSKAERIRADEVVDTGMVRATCGPVARAAVG